MKKIHADFFALGAAGLNGTIGVLTKFGLENTSHHAIAFWKCFGAFLLLLAFTLPKADYRYKVLGNRLRCCRFWAFFAFTSLKRGRLMKRVFH